MRCRILCLGVDPKKILSGLAGGGGGGSGHAAQENFEKIMFRIGLNRIFWTLVYPSLIP